MFGGCDTYLGGLSLIQERNQGPLLLHTECEICRTVRKTDLICHCSFLSYQRMQHRFLVPAMSSVEQLSEAICPDIRVCSFVSFVCVMYCKPKHKTGIVFEQEVSAFY